MAGKTYRFRISNVGLTTSINFRIQGHRLLLVEVEGIHTLQNTYDSLDIHLGQSYSVLVTADQPAQDYYIVISTRFTTQMLTTTSTLHYSNSAGTVSGPLPGGPTNQIDWSLEQARSIRYFPVSPSYFTCHYPRIDVILLKEIVMHIMFYVSDLASHDKNNINFGEYYHNANYYYHKNNSLMTTLLILTVKWIFNTFLL